MGTDYLNKEKVYKKLVYAIDKNKLSEVDNDYLKEEYFKIHDKDGYNLVLRAACRSKLKSIPQHLLTQSLLIDEPQKTGIRTTGLHIAAASGELKHIPKPLLNIKNLSIKDSEGENVYEIALRHWGLETIPLDTLTEKVILSENENDMNLLDSLGQSMDWHLHNFGDPAAWKAQAKKLIQKISTNTLETLITSKNQYHFKNEIITELTTRKNLKKLFKEEQEEQRGNKIDDQNQYI